MGKSSLMAEGGPGGKRGRMGGGGIEGKGTMIARNAVSEETVKGTPQ
jgi:hypothetical protein